MTQEIHSCNLHCENPECIKAQRDDLRDRYFSLCDIQASSLKQAQLLGENQAREELLSFKERLADAIEEMPFGDTSASFAAFVRGFE